ncbi:hypothetical protein AAF712_012576 [Marasmius tenuissimus]|uniref:Ser-Thr-rich glycosyl-phosphatidyl-inositol-anchored membrane family-domain-containing protein n=1 Tax=Marasmius tenuissimus TaxID=585030 RepID=A0ABR2ZIS0_9AGAR
MQLGISALFALFAATAAVSASPVAKRDVWSPPITSPDAYTVWKTDEKYYVTWDNSYPPEVITRGNQINLMNFNQYLFGDEGYNVVIKSEDTFNLLDGYAEIVVPSDIPTDDQYFITLFGDSGNRSPKFRIENAYY